jgi:hypothetical protein
MSKMPLTENSEVLLILEHLAEGVLVFAVPNPQNATQESLGQLPTAEPSDIGSKYI